MGAVSPKTGLRLATESLKIGGQPARRGDINQRACPAPARYEKRTRAMKGRWPLSAVGACLSAPIPTRRADAGRHPRCREGARPTATAAWTDVDHIYSGDARESARPVALGSSTPQRGSAKKFSDFMAALPEYSPIGNSIIGSGVYVRATSDKYSCQFACFLPSVYGY